MVACLPVKKRMLIIAVSCSMFNGDDDGRKSMFLTIFRLLYVREEKKEEDEARDKRADQIQQS